MPQPPVRSALALVVGAIVLSVLLVGSQMALGGDWRWISQEERVVFAAVAIGGAIVGGMLLRDWRWPAAAGAAVLGFAFLALASIAREEGAAGVARAMGSWWLPWPLVVGLVAVLVAGVAVLGVFAGEVLAARRTGMPWPTTIPLHWAGLGPAVLGALVFALLLTVALAVWWALILPTLLLAPIAIGAAIRSQWWYLTAPLAVLTAAMMILPAGYAPIGILAAPIVAGLAVLGVRALGPLMASLDARGLRLARILAGTLLVAILGIGLYRWVEQTLGEEPWWPGNVPQGPVTALWRSPGGAITSSVRTVRSSYIAAIGYPAIVTSADTVYTSATGAVTALEAKTGAERWAIKATTGWSDLFAIRPDGIILIGSHVDIPATPSSGGARWWSDISALEAATGEPRWTYRPGVEHAYIAVTADAAGDTILTACGAGRDGAVCALASDTGSELWRHPLGAGAGSAIAPDIAALGAAGDAVYVATADGTLAALDAVTGNERWQIPIVVLTATDAENGPASWIARITITAETIFLSSEEFAPGVLPVFASSRLLAIDPASGRVRWEFHVGGAEDPRGLSTVDADGEAVYVADSLGVLYALDVANGEERWRFTPEEPASARCERESLYRPVAVGKRIVFSPECLRRVSGGRNLGTSMVYGIEVATGSEQWATQLPGHLVGTPAIMHDTVVVATGQDAALLALDLATGQQRWRAEPIGNMVSAPAIVDDTVYVATTTVRYGFFGDVHISGSAIVAFQVQE